jgi:hemoglobin
MSKKLLENRDDLSVLVNKFYARVRQDELIGPIFNDVAKVDWEEHIPKITDFWDAFMFGGEAYRGRPFPPHIPLGLKPEHFKRWLELFFATVDELFIGQKADEIKMRAFNIGRNFLTNLEHIAKNQK